MIIFLKLNEVNNDLTDMILEEIFLYQQNTVKIQNFLELVPSIETFPSPLAYIIYFDNEKEIIEMFDNLELKLFNRRAKVIVISNHIFKHSERIATNIANLMTKANIFDVIIILKNYTFIHNNEKPKSLKVIFIEIPFLIHQKGTELGGIEFKILNITSNQLDVPIIFQESTVWGNLDNGTATGTLKHLQSGNFDIAAGGYQLVAPRHQYFDFSTIYDQDIYIWCIKHSPLNQSMTFMLNWKLWLIILVSFLTNAMIILIFSRLHKNEKEYYKTFINVFFVKIAILCNISLAILPKSFRVRYILFAIFCFDFVLNVIYTSFLVSLLSDRDYEDKYKTVDDIFENEFNLYFTATVKRIYRSFVHSNQTRTKLFNCENDNTLKCLKYISLHEKCAICVPYLSILSENLKKQK